MVVVVVAVAVAAVAAAAAEAMALTPLLDPKTPSGSNQTSTKLRPKSRSLQIYGLSLCLLALKLRHQSHSSGQIGSTPSPRMQAYPSRHQMKCPQAVASSPIPRESSLKSNGSLTQVQDRTTPESTQRVLMKSSCVCQRLECSTRTLMDSCRLLPSRSSAMELLQTMLLPCPPSQVLDRGTSSKLECAPA